MPVWRLSPVDLSDPCWEASSHRGPAVVRAPGEDLARDTAEKAFAAKSRFVPGQGLRVPPWKRPELVRCELIDHPFHAAEGPTEVLEPSFDQDLQPQSASRRPGD